MPWSISIIDLRNFPLQQTVWTCSGPVQFGICFVHPVRFFRFVRPLPSVLLRLSFCPPHRHHSPCLVIAVSDSSPPPVENLVEVVLCLLKRGLKVSAFFLQILDIVLDAFLFDLEAFLNHREFLQNEPMPSRIDPLACVLDICFGLVWRSKKYTHLSNALVHLGRLR